jgi:dTDP-4-dehydrorhamnose 3,5-epimerase
MRIEQTPLQDCYIVYDDIFEDNRGSFCESFNRKLFCNLTGIDADFVQDNQSSSIKGVLRGLHFQKGNAAQAKLVRVLHGTVWDVAVDIRIGSVTFGQYYGIELSATSRTQFFIPRGFAHGFVTLSDKAIFFYKCDNYYNKQAEGGLIYNDPQLNIDWKLNEDEFILSDKDKVNPSLQQIIETL